MNLKTAAHAQERPGGLPSSTAPSGNHNVPLACNLAGIPAERRADHRANAEYLFATRVAEVQDVGEGYAFRFAPEDYGRVAEFVANERLCCPFFNFVVEVTPNQGPVWLRITGQEGAKQVLQAELNLDAQMTSMPASG